MFLSTLHDSNAFSFCMGGGLSSRRAAIEAELRHLPDFSGSGIVVEAEGGCIILTGSVNSQVDLYRALNVANDIAGAERVIFRVTHGPSLFV